MKIESVDELLYAYKENGLKSHKGFGETTQQNLIETIGFYLKSKDSFIFSQINLIEEGPKSPF